MATHNGKIGSLPPLIQEELNNRLLRDQSSTTILAWLNHIPQVVAVLRDHFEGSPVSPQNLSEWRRGGYLQWLVQNRNVVRQRSEGGPLETEPYHGPFDENAVTQAESDLRREVRDAEQAQAERQARATASVRRAGRPTSSDEFHDQVDSLYEDAAELGDSGIRAKELLHVITARYAELLQDWGKVPDSEFHQRMETLQQLTKNIAIVRRLEQNDERLDFLREKERKKSRSASSRPARASGSQSASETAESPSESRSECASSQPASDATVTNSAPNHQRVPSPAPSDESDTSDPSDKTPAPNAHPASEADATPGGSALIASEPAESHRIPPPARTPFPANSRDRRSRFGLL